MYVLNITFSIEKSIFKDWILWYKTEGEKLLFEDQYVQASRLFNIIGADTDEEETRCVHIEFKNNKDLHRFYIEGHHQFTKAITNNFGEKCLYFASVLELIQEK